MNNDLISRDALKEAIRKRLCISSLKYLTAQEKVIVDEIDNAPTVEVYTSNQVKELVDLNRKLSEERPTGEWIDHSEDYGYAECPFCHELTNCEGNIDELHFCWNCGAKLEKGGAE